MVGVEFEERGREGNFGGCVIGDSHGGVDLLVLLLCFDSAAYFVLAHDEQFLLERGFLLRRFLPVFVPWWSTGNLAAKWIWHTFGISDFWRSARDGDERLQHGVDENPADLPSVAAGNCFLLLLQGPRLFEAKILADEAAFHHFHVAWVSGRGQCSERRVSTFNFLRVTVFEEFSHSGCFRAAKRCFGDERERMWERSVLPPLIEGSNVL